MNIIPFQTELRPELPNVYGTKDYREFRVVLIKMDELLGASDFESRIISKELQAMAKEQQDPAAWLSGKKSQYHYSLLRHGLRCNIARVLTGESCRRFSTHLADSTLFQWFTGISEFGACKASSKSSLDRYKAVFDEQWLTDEIHGLLAQFSDVDFSARAGLSNPVAFDAAWTDSTCVKANIHFPVDWVLLRDAVRTLILSIQQIRKHGLKHRMDDPRNFLKKMNNLCIQMTHTRRQKEGKKQRKKILREIKELTKTIERHALRYRELLIGRWNKVGLSEGQQQQITARIDNVLTQLPGAIKQAHERIIGERQLLAKDKIISLYDHDAQVIVRGKAGNEVEFGQRLFITEQKDGLIIDWEMQGKDSKTDTQMLKPIVGRIEKNYGPLSSMGTDRGFNSAKNTVFLGTKSIYDATCPRSPVALKEKLSEPEFAESQTRRSQTEGRIAVFKNVFLGRPLRSQMLSNKRCMVNWCVLTHNLWVLARMALADEASGHKKAA